MTNWRISRNVSLWEKSYENNKAQERMDKEKANYISSFCDDDDDNESYDPHEEPNDDEVWLV